MLAYTKTIWRRFLGQSGPSAARVGRGGEERRIWVRFPANLETTLKTAGTPDATRISVKVRNISLGGINVLVNRVFQPGELVSIDLPRGAEASPWQVLACVVHCKREQSGQWALGCNFARDLSPEDLEWVGAQQQRPPAVDQRQWQRFPCNITATFQRAADEDPQPCQATVLNVSVSGVGLLIDHPVENGTLLSVDLHDANGDMQKTMLACIVHVTRRSENAWALGCNFIRSLPEADLKALLHPAQR